MPLLNLKTSHKPVAAYYESLGRFGQINIFNESAVKVAFQNLLETCGRQYDWSLVLEWEIKRQKMKPLRVDGALVDGFKLPHGYWEAKDEKDDLEKEARAKLELGYPKDNILFQSPNRAILYQNGRQLLNEDITKPENLVGTLKHFFEYLPPVYADWEDAVASFGEKVPQLAKALDELIEEQRKKNKRYRDAFEGFAELCRQSVNPNLSDDAVEEMLIQHLLTERIFRKVFNNSDFTRRNVIAAEIEQVIDALTSQAFNRDAFLGKLDHFYRAIEATAATIDDYTQKQHFLNAVYEKFFQGFSVKTADTHGIVYTPQPIVNFMVKSVEEILQKEFGKSLSSPGVHILDPFVGTGNFLVRVMQEIKRTALKQKYLNELHCNEVMLLPYYVASMNIEHEYFELTGSYEPFAGICLVDTFELAEGSQEQLAFMNPENTQRVQRQKQSPITVIIGNPPYNVGQLNENDNNKNRKYKVIDKRVSSTYAKDSKAASVNKLNNPYVKAIRWASDRVEDEGIVAFISDSSFIDKKAFDGMRMHLGTDFSHIYILDLKGDVRSDSMREGFPIGEDHTIFGLAAMVGIAITFFVKKKGTQGHSIFYAEVDWKAKRKEKLALLEEAQTVSRINFREIQPDANHTWLTEGLQSDYESFVSIGSQESKKSTNAACIFSSYSIGVNTNRDDWAYNYGTDKLLLNMGKLIKTYNSEVYRWKSSPTKLKPKDVDKFVLYDDSLIKWSSRLKECLVRGLAAELSSDKIRNALFRPFISTRLYFDQILNQRRGRFAQYFPNITSEIDNRLIIVGGYGRKPFSAFISHTIADLNFYGDPAQCFPFYIYDEDGTNRRENITDWALARFREHYRDEAITKWDIFHYVYAVLHHPVYRERYAANLKRELPRIPFTPDFHAFASAGARLAELHVHYETQPEYPLEEIENPKAKLDWRVTKMKLSKDKQRLVYNEFLTLDGIPAAAFEYRLGNRSALEWVIDQYQVSTDKRSGITNDPNREDDPEYIVRLIGQVITVSLETQRIVNALPELGIAAA